MAPAIEIAFECLPLRSIAKIELSVEASPALEDLYHRISAAAEKHGRYNTYYLHAGACVFHLTSDPVIGALRFRFEGTVFTDAQDQETVSADLQVALVEETCDWLTSAVVDWFAETVRHAVVVEFNRYIAAGDLQKAIQRIERIQAESDARGGYVGLGL